MNKNYLIFLFTNLLFLLAASCTTIKPQLSLKDQLLLQKPLTLDLKMGRKFLTGLEYENFRADDATFHYECGHLAKKKSSRESNLIPVGKGIKDLTESELLELKKIITKFFTIYNKREQVLPQPGDIKRLSDSGFIVIQINHGKDNLNIATSVNAVSDSTSTTLSELRFLISSIRGIGPIMCDAPTFYGIPRNNIITPKDQPRRDIFSIFR